MRSQSKAGRVFESRRRRFRPYNFTARAPDNGAEGIALLLRPHRGVKDTGGFFDSGQVSRMCLLLLGVSSQVSEEDFGIEQILCVRTLSKLIVQRLQQF